MRELVIVRHGLAHCNLAGVVGGPRGCTGLTDLGRAQVALLAERLCQDAAGGLPVTAVRASPPPRARE
ncbi:MAG: histidine phosphatase family protein, partial [Pseudonocardiaceae bacterium]